MRFKAGFVLGCAVGVVAAAKAAELRRLEKRSPSHPAYQASEATAARFRALGDLARERISSYFETPGGEARDRMNDLIGTSLGGISSRAGSSRHHNGTSRWPN